MNPLNDHEMWLHLISILPVCSLLVFSVFFFYFLFLLLPPSFLVTASQMFYMSWNFGRIKMGRPCARGSSKEMPMRRAENGMMMMWLIEVLPEGKSWTKFEREKGNLVWMKETALLLVVMIKKRVHRFIPNHLRQVGHRVLGQMHIHFSYLIWRVLLNQIALSCNFISSELKGQFLLFNGKTKDEIGRNSTDIALCKCLKPETS